MGGAQCTVYWVYKTHAEPLAPKKRKDNYWGNCSLAMAATETRLIDVSQA